MKFIKNAISSFSKSIRGASPVKTKAGKHRPPTFTISEDDEEAITLMKAHGFHVATSATLGKYISEPTKATGQLGQERGDG